MTDTVNNMIINRNQLYLTHSSRNKSSDRCNKFLYNYQQLSWQYCLILLIYAYNILFDLFNVSLKFTSCNFIIFLLLTGSLTMQCNFDCSQITFNFE